MKPVEFTITAKALATVFGSRQGMPSPDGPDFDPRGPIGPIAFEVARILGAARFSAVALNPQPIPPLETVARLIAQEFVAGQLQLQALARALPGESGGVVAKRLDARTSEFLEYCGTGRIAQLIAELLRKLGPPKGGGEPPPRPNEVDIGIAQLTIGAELFQAGSLAQGLEQAGAQLMGIGLKQLG